MVSAAAKEAADRSSAVPRATRVAIIWWLLANGDGGRVRRSNASRFRSFLGSLGCTANRDWHSRSISCPKSRAAQFFGTRCRKSVFGEQKTFIRGLLGYPREDRAGE